MRKRVHGLLIGAVLVAVAACGTEPPAETPVYEPAGGEYEPPVPALPPVDVGTPFPTASATPADPNVATRLTLFKSETTRFGLPISPAQLDELGWGIDIGRGSAVYVNEGVGREEVEWLVPPPTIFAPDGVTLTITGRAWSAPRSNLNFEPGLYLYGFGGSPSQVGTQAFSVDAKVTTAPEVRLWAKPRPNAFPGEEARIEVTIGWQGEGIAVVYRYRYEP